MSKTKIFVSAFSCMPHIGSEPGVGWHWIMEMSKYYELWVLVHKEPIDDIEKYVKQHGIDQQIHFIYFDIPLNSLFFKDGKFRWVRTYYVLWTMLANKIVRKTMEENGIEIFHNLTFGNAIWPVSHFGQKKIFIWGPIGGVETIPKEFSINYNFKSRCFEAVRRIMVKSLIFNWGFLKRCRNANLILCKTEDMLNTIPSKYQHKAHLCTDVAVETRDAESAKKIQARRNDIDINFLSVGRLDGWRGFDLLIEAFAIAAIKIPHMKLTILGDGIERNNLENLACRKGVSNIVNFIGSVSVNDYIKYIQSCDVVVNSCLKEGAVTVSFDSMRYGKPLICIDSGGFTKYFNREYAIVLPRNNRQELICSLAEAMLKMTNKDIRESMGEKAKTAGNSFSWDVKGTIIFKLIDNALTMSSI